MDKEIFMKANGKQRRWVSFENPTGEKGKGGMANHGAKGSAFAPLEAGGSIVLCDIAGEGLIDYLWITLSNRTPKMLRSVKLEMFWDGETKPAVSVPFGDFFCTALGEPIKFESAYLSNPEGRSFNSFFKMPFKRSAKIVITNESSEKINACFYNISYLLCPIEENFLYFHSYWNRENPTTLEKDYTIIPKISGAGTYIGSNVCVDTIKKYSTPDHGVTWFGEGETKIYLDGDTKYPTLCSTGTEDYIGTAWGQGEYANQTQGCLKADKEGGKFSFYKFHKEDPVYFYEDIRVEMQVIGGSDKEKLLNIIKENNPELILVTTDDGNKYQKLYKTDFVFDENSVDGWYNFWRKDDYSSTAYFYYEKPSSDLPELMGIEKRIESID